MNDHIAASMSLLVVFGMAGCGDATTAVRVNLSDSNPVYAAYRSDGAWTRPERVSTTEFSFEVASSYEFVAVCQDALGRTDIEVLRASPSDGDQTIEPDLSNGSCRNTEFTGEFGRVQGHVDSRGYVWVGNFSKLTTDATLSYDFGAAAGSRDAVFIGLPTDHTLPRAAIQRDLLVPANVTTVLDPVDLSLAPSTVLLTAIADSAIDESISVSSDLRTQNHTHVSISAGSGGKFLAIGPELLLPTDLEVVTVTARTPTTLRAGVARVESGDVKVGLLPLVRSTFESANGVVDVAWDGRISADIGTVVRLETPETLVHVVTTPTLSVGTSQLSVDLAPTAPGWDPSWQPAWGDDLSVVDRTFIVFRQSDAGTTYSSITTPAAK